MTKVDRGKKITFEKLFKEHYKELYFHALSFVRDTEEARDIVNDVFEQVWDHYASIDTQYSLKPFLYKLVRNRSIDYLRKEKARERFTSCYHQSRTEEEEDYSGYEELMEKTMALIGEMPAQTAAVFRKCFIERKKYKETAAELHITVNTVRTHISKALRILRRGLSGEEMTFLFFILKKI